MKKASTIVAAAAAVFLAHTPVASAQRHPLECEHDETMASVVCIVRSAPVVIHDILVNGGRCLVWDHRLVRAGLARQLREAGTIESETDYGEQELSTFSAAIVDAVRNRELAVGDFFRFETYRCTIEEITIKASTGDLTLQAAN